MAETEVATKQTYWFKQIADWEASQESQKAFCATNNLSFAQFGYWRKKYYKAKTAPTPTKTSGPWLSLTATSPTPTGHLTICIPHRCTMTLPLNIAPAQLEAILSLLGLKHVCTG